MSKTVSVTLVICWLLSMVIPLCAQNILINPYSQYNLLIKKDDLFPERPSELEIYPGGPIKTDKQSYDTLFNYRVSSAIYNKPFYLLIENHGLFDKYLQELELVPAQKTQPEIKKLHNAIVDHKLFNALCSTPKIDEEKMIREAWKRSFGIDVWYPYYKAKEVEDWIKERLTVRIFKLKGKPKFKKNQILYIFKTTF